MNFNNLEFHELADLFPLLQGKELQKIVDDIKANGFRPEPITLLGGKILDGRNRYNAAKLAGHELQPLPRPRSAPVRARKKPASTSAHGRPAGMSCG